MGIAGFLKKNALSLKGKRIAVSGSTGGIGRALCRHLAALGADLILLDRSKERTERLTRELLADFPERSVRWIPTDLSDMASVAVAAVELLQDPPDGLILNAGVYHVPRFQTSSGLDNVFQINCAAPLFLAERLAPAIGSRGGRIVGVGSIAHRYSKSDPEDVEFLTRKGSARVYGNSKRYLTVGLWELSARYSCVSLTHPGITPTGITAHYPRLLYALIRHPMRLIFMTPKRASLSILSGLFWDCAPGEWIGPRLFGVWGLPCKRRLRSIGREEGEEILNALRGLPVQIYTDRK